MTKHHSHVRDFLQDYGMWERGDKTNQGIPELNGSSVGMAKVGDSFFSISTICSIPILLFITVYVVLGGIRSH